jgi:hypothetical protein
MAFRFAGHAVEGHCGSTRCFIHKRTPNLGGKGGKKITQKRTLTAVAYWSLRKLANIKKYVGGDMTDLDARIQAIISSENEERRKLGGANYLCVARKRAALLELRNKSGKSIRSYKVSESSIPEA